MVTASEIKAFCPSAKPALVKAIVDNWSAAEQAGITTADRIAHFMAQIAVETGSLSAVEESLNYTAAGLRKTFGSHRISDGDCAKYGRTETKKANVKAIANAVYGGEWGRKNLGNTEAGDGWMYRGGGMLQTTGRRNYRKMGFEANPEALRDPATAFLTAVREWSSRGCNALADIDDLLRIRKAINGGTNGLAEARDYLAKAKKVWRESAPVKVIDHNPELSIAETRELQTKLFKLGYTEVGRADGKIGSRTRGAILAFQADNNLPLTGAATWELLLRVSEGKAREVSDARRSATKADLSQHPVVSVGATIDKVGKTLLTATGVGAAVDGAFDLENITNSVNKVNAFVETITSLSPWIIGVVGGVAVLWIGRRMIDRAVTAYREGRLL